MASQGLTISKSIQSRKWPAVGAKFAILGCVGDWGAVGAAFVAVADDVIVPKISSMLEATGRDEREPSVLAQNSGIAFKGMEMYGLGFVVDADVATAWISTDSRYGDVVKPFPEWR